GVDDNIRADGRGRLDYRQVSLETGVISQASGSARCKLGEGTDVLVGVKIEIGAIEIDGNYEQVMEIKSKRGRVVCNVECSPIASQQFAGKGAEDINNELTQTIERVFNGPQGATKTSIVHEHIENSVEKRADLNKEKNETLREKRQITSSIGQIAQGIMPILNPRKASILKQLKDEEISLQRKEEQIEKDKKKYVMPHSIPLGYDRFYNKYFYFDGLGITVGEKYGTGKIWVQVPQEQDLRMLTDRDFNSSPIASQQFAGKGAEDINNELTQTIERVFNGPQGGINLEKLCIIPGQQCWVVYIDALVLDYAGNILDTIFITTRAALYNARVPKTIIQDHGDGEFEFEISDDVEEWERIYGWDMVPVGVTLNRIGTRHIVDATPLEELATEAKLLTGRTVGLDLISSLDSMLKNK
ncbi:12928_t:CDS:10, partial [Entrophospora sp. SA101]